MCVEFLKYTACNHQRRHFLKKCKFMRNVGCFEPMYAYLFGARGKVPCQFPKVEGEVHIVEGWCSQWCQGRYEGLDPRLFKGRTPSVYLRERLTEVAIESGLEVNKRNQRSLRTMTERKGAGASARNEAGEAKGLVQNSWRAYHPSGDALQAPRPPQSLYGRPAHRRTGEDVVEPRDVPLERSFRERRNGEQKAPAVEPRRNLNPFPLQKRSKVADRSARNHRSRLANVNLQKWPSESATADPPRDERYQRPVSDMYRGMGAADEPYNEEKGIEEKGKKKLRKKIKWAKSSWLTRRGGST